MQKQFKYIYNNEEVSREDFEKLAGDSFKWFDGDSVVSVPFSSFDSSFTGNFKSRRQINDHLKGILNGASTRHKSQNGETYKEIVGNLEDDINNRLKLSKKINKESIEKYKSLFTKEDKKLIKEIGVKYNQLKPRLDVVINTQFPKALQLISLATEYGNSKYKETDLDMLNFKRVAGGSQTYFDSCARHSTDRNGLDESGLPHIIHAVWSSLAGLELWAEENKINIKEFTENYMKNLQD